MFLTRICLGAAALALIGVIVAIGLSISNQSLQKEVSDRQQAINQGLALAQLNTRLVNTLATIATRDNDAKIKDLLTQQGFTLTTNPAPAPPAVAK